MWPAPLSCSEAARIESSPTEGLIPPGLCLTDHLANEKKGESHAALKVIFFSVTWYRQLFVGVHDCVFSAD